jgi:hypothetical protein
MAFDKETFQDMYRAAVESPTTLTIALTLAGAIPVDTAEAVTRLIQDSRGNEEWYEVLLGASSIIIGRGE